MIATDTQTCTTDAPATTRICRRCLQSLPVDRFSLRSTVSQKRQTWCNQCHSEYNRERQLRQSKKRDEQRLFAAWAKIASAKQRRTCVQTVIVNLVLRYGGPAGLASAWFSAFERASSVRQLRACESMIFLIERFASNPECLNVQRIDDLEAEQARLARLIIKEQLLANPDSVAAIAKQHGYTLTPARDQATTSIE